ncbi:MAG: hypothetical protein B7Z82_03765, partial [Halothiobacillus sp. 20-54-6]
MSVPKEHMMPMLDASMKKPSSRIRMIDGIYALILLAGASYAYVIYSAAMGSYGSGTLWGAALGLAFLGWL